MNLCQNLPSIFISFIYFYFFLLEHHLFQTDKCTNNNVAINIPHLWNWVPIYGIGNDNGNILIFTKRFPQIVPLSALHFTLSEDLSCSRQTSTSDVSKIVSISFSAPLLFPPVHVHPPLTCSHSQFTQITESTEKAD